LRLVDDADVLIESFPPGTMAGWGLSQEQLRTQNPRLVVASISPFGQEGPYRDYQMTDLLTWAASGSMTIVGVEGQEPLAVGTGLSYYATGVLTALACVAALFGEDTRQGVDVSLVEGMIQLLGSGSIHENSRALRKGRDPLSQPQPCKDGYAAINPISPQHW